MLKCSFLLVQHPKKPPVIPRREFCTAAAGCAPREGAMRILVGNVLGTFANLRQRDLPPFAELFLCFSRTAFPVVRTNPTFGFSQRFEKLCRCILNSMDVENEPKVSRGVWFGVGRAWW